jgi:hypothetical protein
MSSKRHPSTRMLRYWLRTGRPSRIGEHIAGCDRCTQLLDDDPVAARILEALADATAPPDGLEKRMTVAVSQAVRNRQALGALTELFGLGWHTGIVLVERVDGTENNE